jgi:mannan endo-1,6-alpha-mannosidase
MEVTLSCLIQDRPPALKANTGGTSAGDPGSGGNDIGRQTPELTKKGSMSTGDTVGAAFLTITVLACLLAGIVWMLLDETSEKSALQQIKTLSFAGVHNTAAGSAVAGPVTLKKPSDELSYDEKGKTVMRESSQAISRSTSDSPSSNELDESITPAPLQRRLSSMPRGWPNNPSLRPPPLAAVQGDQSGRPRVLRKQLPASAQQPVVVTDVTAPLSANASGSGTGSNGASSMPRKRV